MIGVQRWEDRRCEGCGEQDNPVDGIAQCPGCVELLCTKCLLRHDERHAYAEERAAVRQLVSENYPEDWLR